MDVTRQQELAALAPEALGDALRILRTLIKYGDSIEAAEEWCHARDFVRDVPQILDAVLGRGVDDVADQTPRRRLDVEHNADDYALVRDWLIAYQRRLHGRGSQDVD
jgi:hypothetical protein